MSTVDDLVGSLFPGVKLPPPTKVSATASSSVGNTSSPPAPQQEKVACHNFDDSDEESPQKKAPVVSAGKVGAPPFIPKSNGTPIVNKSEPTLKFSTTTVQWPVLPKNLLQVCPTSVRCVLSNYVPDHSARVHTRLLFGGAGSTVQQDASQDQDSSVMDSAVGTVNYCPFIRCNKCGHPVVRMQNAYVAQSLEQKKKLEAPASKAVKSAGGAHNWDDSDEDDSSHCCKEGASVDPMYMLSRNHYPDFTRLDRAGALRRVETTVGNSVSCALYWCQCSMVSCFARRALVDSNNSAEATAAVLEPPAAIKQERAAAGETPFSTKEIKWACVGHCQSM